MPVSVSAMSQEQSFGRQISYSSDVVSTIVCDKMNAGHSFFLVDIADILRKYDDWCKELPRFRPFYAVKCNTTETVLRTLSKLGAGFDCASQSEIETALSIGVKPENIIFANPCKTSNALKYAKSVGVDLMTFDSEEELYKIKQHFSDARVVLRIKTNDTLASTPLSIKYGAEVSDMEFLLQFATKLGLKVVGISFHVGSNTGGVNVYKEAIRDAKIGFDLAKKFGHEMTLLDIGGGFPGNRYTNVNKTTLSDIAAAVNEAIDEYFGDAKGIQLIAEPGRYFVASAFTLVTKIVSRKVLKNNQVMYYLMDGIYGAFSNVWCDSYIPNLIPMVSQAERKNRKQLISTFWGPTCDSVDCVLKDVNYIEMKVGEWVFAKDMGAYSIVAGTKFNGFSVPPSLFVVPEKARKELDLPFTPLAYINNGNTFVCKA
ncbi:ornithine decarboxylase 2-like protein [Leptotrombidium deliense]|uniref:ornithine decarboxylase n=1 Tax=Leptotrombidium deliense TaxID=299467 RepID=A0A443SEY4_9ACAR|nr:ornithine decarboxylase 2-like protein [Leptotrombidium deliense]